MHYQKQNPYPDDWWAEKTRLGVSRQNVAWLLIVAVTAIALGYVDWDWVFGLR